MLDKVVSKKSKVSFPTYITEKSLKEKIRGDFLSMGINFEEDKIVSVCPGSGALEIHKRWPAEKFGKLIEGLMRFTNLKFFILGTYEEIDLEYMILFSRVTKIMYLVLLVDTPLKKQQRFCIKVLLLFATVMVLCMLLSQLVHSWLESMDRRILLKLEFTRRINRLFQ